MKDLAAEAVDRGATEGREVALWSNKTGCFVDRRVPLIN